MLSEDEQVKILDFGMARLLQDVSVTITGTFKGTIRYTSPEQIQDSKRVEAASDQFAFGLMSFEALTGKFPYQLDEKNPMASLFARMQNQAQRLTEADSSFSEQTADVLAKMLATRAEERYETVEIAFQALKQSLL